MSAYEDELHKHVHGFFEGHEAQIRTWEHGRLDTLGPDFHVVELGPGPRTGGYTYVTVGAGRIAPDNGRRLEFVLCGPEAADRHVHLLYMTAFYHLSGETLDVGHTFTLGEPWVVGSSLDCMLVSLPYPFGRSLEVFDHGDHHSHIMWLLPITQAERALAGRAGVEALESLLEERAISFLDPRRSSVVDEI
jgi:hypothetical protein